MELPRDIQDFVIRNIDSVAELEALLLFFRNPESAFNAAELANQLYISEAAAGEVIRSLARRGFLTPASADAANHLSYKYLPTSDELRQRTAALGELYSKALIPITQLIHNKPSSAITQFADAFRLRERK